MVETLSIGDLHAAFEFGKNEKKFWEDQYKIIPEENEEEVKKANEKCKYWNSVLTSIEKELRARIKSIFPE